jgi:hypothetical protein
MEANKNPVMADNNVVASAARRRQSKQTNNQAPSDQRRWLEVLNAKEEEPHCQLDWRTPSKEEEDGPATSFPVPCPCWQRTCYISKNGKN